jgi:AMMECR1 domain-containing protein
MTKFQVAKELGMDAGSDDFKTVIEEVPCDDDWDVQNLMERAFSKAGLKRYRWDMKRLVH